MSHGKQKPQTMRVRGQGNNERASSRIGNNIPQKPADVKPLDQIRDALGGHNLCDGSVMARCPAHDDRTPSLHLTADGDKLLVHCLAGCNQEDVIQALRDLGLWSGSNGDTPTTTEPNLPPGIPRRWYGAPYVAHWTYRDSQGQVIGHVARYEGQDGKQVVPFFRAQGSDWRAGAAPAPRPLYGLDRLAGQPELPVIVVEGEKAADAAGWLLQGRYVAITWPGGTNAAGKADWSPTRGRDVMIWPDADEPGRKAGQAVAQRCREAGTKSVTVVAPPGDVPEGWDLADAVEAGWTPQDVQEWIEQHTTSSNQAQDNLYLDSIITGPELHSAFLRTLDASWRIQDIIPESSGLNLIYGAPGTYKSFVAVDMAMSIATGKSWHGRDVASCPVLYMAAEGQSGVLKRIQAWMQYYNLSKIEDLHLMPRPCFLDVSDELDAFMSTLKSLQPQPQYIIIDTLARCMAGDENSTADMGKVINACTTIKDTTQSQIKIIHHTGKDEGRGARGAIALTGATDTQILVKSPGGRRVVLTCDRQKDYERFQPIGFNLEAVDTGYTDKEGGPVTSLVPVLDPAISTHLSRPRLNGAKLRAYEALKAACADQPAIHLDRWRDAAYQAGITASSDPGAKQKAFKRAVEALNDLGYVTCDNDYYSPT